MTICIPMLEDGKGTEYMELLLELLAGGDTLSSLTVDSFLIAFLTFPV